jgi:hypothetical protein
MPSASSSRADSQHEAGPTCHTLEFSAFARGRGARQHLFAHALAPSVAAREPSLVEADAIVLRALAKDLAQRFPDARALGRALAEQDVDSWSTAAVA